MTLTAMIITALWWGPFLLLIRLWDRRPSLGDFHPVDGIPLSVIIPARNEARTIGTVLESLARSSYRSLEIVVVDDRSTDETAAIVAEYAAEDDRIVLINGKELPEGWYGKPWACCQGYGAASGDVLVFTDADTRHQPELLAKAVGAMQAQSADLVTVAPHQVCLGFWERVVMPQVWAVLGVQYHPRTVNRSRSLRTVIANGQFILMPRRSYESVGTHEAVKGAVAEDLAIAQRTVELGGTIFFAFATKLMETRMYTNLPELIEGWSKNLYLGGLQALRGHPVRQLIFPLFLPLLTVYWLLPPVALLVCLSGGGGPWLVPSALATVGSLLFWMAVAVGMRIPAVYGLFYPLGAVILGSIAARSTIRGSRRVEWRGRVYSGGSGGGGGSEGGPGTSG